MNHGNEFEGERLFLRAFEPGDAQALLAYLNHPDLYGRRYIPWSFPGMAPLSLKDAEGIIAKWGEERDGLYLAIVEKDEGKLVGHAMCDWGWDPHSPFIALVIEPARQRQGYGSEILALLLRYLFGQTPAYNISSWAADWNTPALNFAMRHGFRECGRSRREGLYKGRYYDEILVDILRPEWLKAKPGLNQQHGKT